MPSDLQQRRVRVGSLNRLNEKPDGIQLDDVFLYTATPQQQIQYILGKQIEKDSRLSIEYPALAVCLWSWVTPCSSPLTDNENFLRGLGQPNLRLHVIAHVPELHSSIKLPERLGPPETMIVPDRRLLGMHPTFLADFSNEARQPSIGDIIQVDFDDRSRLRGGKYLNVYQPSPVAPADISSPANSGRQYFKKSYDRRNKPKSLLSQRERFLNGDFYQYPLTLADY